MPDFNFYLTAIIESREKGVDFGDANGWLSAPLGRRRPSGLLSGLPFRQIYKLTVLGLWRAIPRAKREPLSNPVWTKSKRGIHVSPNHVAEGDPLIHKDKVIRLFPSYDQPNGTPYKGSSSPAPTATIIQHSPFKVWLI